MPSSPVLSEDEGDFDVSSISSHSLPCSSPPPGFPLHSGINSAFSLFTFVANPEDFPFMYSTLEPSEKQQVVSVSPATHSSPQPSSPSLTYSPSALETSTLLSLRYSHSVLCRKVNLMKEKDKLSTR